VLHSPLVDQLTAALGPGYSIERELDGGGMSRVFVAFDAALQRRVAVKVLPEHLAASVSVERFKREILLSAGLQHPHIVGVLSAGEAAGLPFFVMPYVDGESLASRLASTGALSVRDTVSIMKDVSRALAYAHERGIVHRDIKPHNVLLSAGAATVTDFGVAKALSSALRAGEGDRTGTLTAAGMSLGTPLYMAPEQAAADPETDHRADIYALGITAYEMLTGRPPFAGYAPRALLTARLTEDPAPIESVRPDVPAGLASLVMRCLARDPADRPSSAQALLSALDDPAMVSGASAASGRKSAWPHRARSRRAAAVLLATSVIAIVGARVLARRHAAAPLAPHVTVAAPAQASIVLLPLVNIGRDSTNAYLADGITNELAAALGRVRGIRVVSPSRAASMLAAGKSSSEIGRELNVALQLEGTVQRVGKRLRVTARLVDVRDGVMRWSDLYERDATDLLTVQDELSRAITHAVGSELGGNGDTAAEAVATPSPATAAKAAAYDLYLRGRFWLGKRGAAPLREAIGYFERAIAKDPELALAYSGLADAQGLLPLYANVPAEHALASALHSADRAIALDSGLAEAWASRGVLHGRSWRWTEAESDFRRAIALKGSYAPAHQWLGELLIVLGRIPEATTSLERASRLEPSSPVIAGSLALALGLAGRSGDAEAAAERAVSYDSTLLVTRFMLGATRLYARQPRAAVGPLEEAVRIDPTSRTALGLLGFAYAASGDPSSARRTAARIEEMPAGPGKEVALARIALGMGDTGQALDRLERAAKARDPFFATESATSPVFDALRGSARYAALLRRVGLVTVTAATRNAKSARCV
jgi:TolB-like protein/Flp pilus assembly protein TadD